MASHDRQEAHVPAPRVQHEDTFLRADSFLTTQSLVVEVPTNRSSHARRSQARIIEEPPGAPSSAARLSNASSASLYDTDWHKDGSLFGLLFLRYFCASFVVCAAVATGATALWSDIMGFSHEALAFVRRLWILQYICGGAALAIIFVLYMLDFFMPPHLPDSRFILFKSDVCVGRGLVVLGMLCIWTAMLFSAHEYVWLPVLVTIFLCPPLLGLTRLVVRHHRLDRNWNEMALGDDSKQRLEVLRSLTRYDVDIKVFCMATGSALFLVGAIVLLVWVVFLLKNNVVDISSQDSQQRAEWQAVRVSPAFTAASYFFFSSLCAARVALANKYVRTDEHRNLTITKIPPKHQQILMKQRLSRMSVCGVRSFQAMCVQTQAEYLQQHAHYLRQLEVVSGTMAACICLMMAAIYIMYLVADANDGTRNLLLMIQAAFALSCATAVAFVYVMFNRVWTAIGREIGDLPVVAAARIACTSDWMRAVGAFLFGPFFPFLLGLSMVNQLVRKCRGLGDLPTVAEGLSPTQDVKDEPLSSSADIGEVDAGGSCMLHSTNADPPDSESRLKNVKCQRGGVLTWRVQRLISDLQKWQWTSILEKMIILGLCCIAYIVTPILLNILLSQMITVLRPAHMIVVVAAVWSLGLLLFLLPPVPGAPIYAFGGILIAGKGEEEWGESGGFWLGSALCVGVCWVLKLSACALQQKLIGEYLGNHHFVRQAVGVHKPFIRAVEHIMRKPGLSLGKVIILMAGPDWPTSVLAGVLRLSLVQCEIGTMPIIIYIAPLALTGSFYYKRDEGDIWQSTADLMLLITGIETLVLWAAMGWAIQDEMSKNASLFTRPMAQYVDLEWLDYRESKIRMATSVSLTNMPRAVSLCYLFATVGIVAVGHAFFWVGDVCFGNFAATDDIGTISWYGEDRSLLQPIGVVGLVASGLFICCYAVFVVWRSAHASHVRKKVQPEIDVHESAWKEAFLTAAAEAIVAVQAPGIETERVSSAGCARTPNALTRCDLEEEQRNQSGAEVPPEIHHPKPNSPRDLSEGAPDALCGTVVDAPVAGAPLAVALVADAPVNDAPGDIARGDTVEAPETEVAVAESAGEEELSEKPSGDQSHLVMKCNASAASAGSGTPLALGTRRDDEERQRKPHMRLPAATSKAKGSGDGVAARRTGVEHSKAGAGHVVSRNQLQRPRLARSGTRSLDKKSDQAGPLSSDGIETEPAAKEGRREIVLKRTQTWEASSSLGVSFTQADDQDAIAVVGSTRSTRSGQRPSTSPGALPSVSRSSSVNKERSVKRVKKASKSGASRLL
mmetsp:Transcript_50527/g.145655  ORF Transcript_50527/g.145655 Transcript_50527/m.145655 type:complete len:1296 (+) Transcript_50527:104-3991(+)